MDDAILLKSIELVLDNTLGEAAQKRQLETQLSEELRTIPAHVWPNPKRLW